MMSSSRNMDDGRYDYNNYNMSNLGGGGGSTHYSGVIPGIYSGGGYGGGANGYYGHSHIDKTYSVVNTEPITVKKSDPIILIDPPMEPHIKSYLTWSLFNVICCCFVGGVITTFMSCNVMRLNDNKSYKEAERLSGKVLHANMIASAIGALIILIAFPYAYIAIYPSLPKINW